MSGLNESRRLALLDLADDIEASADGCLRCPFDDECRVSQSELPNEEIYIGCIYELTRIAAKKIRSICGKG